MTRLPELRPTTRRLIVACGLRSLGQGALVVGYARFFREYGPWENREQSQP